MSKNKFKISHIRNATILLELILGSRCAFCRDEQVTQDWSHLSDDPCTRVLPKYHIEERAICMRMRALKKGVTGSIRQLMSIASLGNLQVNPVFSFCRYKYVDIEVNNKGI